MISRSSTLFPAFRAAFPDIHWVIEEMVAEGDKVFSHFTWNGTHREEFFGVPATGRQIIVKGLVVDRVVAGKMVESRILMTGSLFAQAASPFGSPSPSTSATPAAQAVTPVPTLEQRVAGLEAYLTNGDPAVPLKDKDGNIPKDLTTASVGTSGPGHNAWMMTSSALVLFMTLPGLALFYGGLVRRKNALSVLAQCLGIKYCTSDSRTRFDRVLLGTKHEEN